MQNTSTTLRLIAVLIDMAVFTLLVLPFIVICIFLEMGDSLYFQIFTFSILLSLLLCKDLVGGRSYGKRKTQLEIKDTKGEGHIPSWRLILRNLTLLVWPLEGLILLFNPRMRLGDYLASTKVKLTDREDNLKVKMSDYVAFIITLFIVYAVSYMVILSLFAGIETLTNEVVQ